MKLTSLAEQLGVHPSTVSRTARGKYLQCRQGTYPLRYFFSRAVSDQGPSQQAVKRKLLEDQGIRLARRTVAKYRMELGLGSSTARKRS